MDLEPTIVWDHFDKLRRVPRPSGRAEAVTAHVDAWAAEHGFLVRRDAFGNRVVVVPASPGLEDAPIVVLQAHLDMVCEKNDDTRHDFATDPIELTRSPDGAWLGARGTTLGADNGVGVALAQAVAVAPGRDRGPLELLFTLDEEIGLVGARALDPSIVEGRLLVNLDAEIDGALFLGCAGAAGVEATLGVTRREPAPGTLPHRLQVRGGRGGHSGLEIDRGRANAVALLAQILVSALDGSRVLEAAALGLAAIDGGDKANAIPREATAVVWLDAAARSALEATLERLRPAIAERFATSDPEIEATLDPLPPAAASQTLHAPAPLEPAGSERLLRLLDALPTGVRSMSLEVPGLVQTSGNLGRVRTGEAACDLLVSLRSSSNPELAAVAQATDSLCRLAGAETRRRPGYPGWKPDPTSPLVGRAVEVHRRLFGAAPSLESVHAGIECGVLAEKLPGLDAISIGPEIRGAHSPSERVSIASTARVHRWLEALLEDVATTTPPQLVTRITSP